MLTTDEPLAEMSIGAAMNMLNMLDPLSASANVVHS